MDVNHAEIIAYIFNKNKYKYGTYVVISKEDRQRQAEITYTADGADIQKACVSNEKLLHLILRGKVVIALAEKNYYYFDENLLLKTKADTGDEEDNKHKAEHNYFDVDDFSYFDLLQQFSEHVCNMRLNLLANFYPEVCKADKTANAADIKSDEQIAELLWDLSKWR